MKTNSILLLAAIGCTAFAAKAQNVVQGGNSIAATMKVGDLTSGYDLQFLTSGSAKMAIKSGGNIGIGTTSPSYLLDVSGGDVNVSGGNGYRIGGYMMLNNNNIFTDVFLGFYAGANTTSASSYNSFLGYAAGYENTSGGFNTATGGDALFYNTTGSYNTANGVYALENNSTGSWNTATGVYALSANNGSYNTANGYQALYSNTTGANNLADGYQALLNNTSGGNNVASGCKALLNNSSGYQNVAIGGSALLSNTTGYINTACGFNALLNNTAGVYNVATGGGAEINLASGNDNTADGTFALSNLTNGSANVAVGTWALQNNNGSYNTGTGYGALMGNPSGDGGSYNTADGEGALEINTSGVGNTAIGANTMTCVTTGYYNTAIGYSSGACLDDTDILYNTTAVGYQAKPTANNEIVLGNTAITEIGAYVSGITNLSDARFKKNIQENVHGLDFIMKLKPVTYNLDVTKLNTFLGVDNNKADKGLTDKQKATIASINDKAVKAKEAIVTSGFIAQDVEQAAKDVNYNFDGVKVPTNDKDHYGLVYDEFVVPLVKAVQEQQAEIDSLKKMIGVLVANHTNTTTPQSPGTTSQTTGSDSLTNVDVTLSDQNVVVLNQNVPNPFSKQTVITYNIPQGSGPAQILFYGSNGQLIKAVNVNANGPGQITVYASDLSNGIYSYTLVIDGKPFATKKMMKGN